MSELSRLEKRAAAYPEGKGHQILAYCQRVHDFVMDPTGPELPPTIAGMVNYLRTCLETWCPSGPTGVVYDEAVRMLIVVILREAEGDCR